MEAFNPSITIPFPYAYTLTNVTTNYMMPTFPPTTCMSSPTTNTTTTTTTTLWMDSRIWSRLPSRLLDRILAFLPPPAFFRARTVCKRWYSLLFSNSFLHMYLQLSLHYRHFFIFFHHNPPKTTTTLFKTSGSGPSVQRAYLFDPYELVWYTIPFALVPPGFSPGSSSGGLLCWVSDESGPKTVVLHNPLVGSMAHLPAPSRQARLFPSVGLSVTGSSIDLTLAGDDLISPYAVKNLTNETFHVDSQGFCSIWTTTSPLPRLCSLETGHMIHSCGRFFCMNYSPFSVLVYEVASNQWWKIQAPMRRFLRSPSLIESQGKVVLVAAVEKSKLNVPRSLRLWALQGCGIQWVEIERMPQQLYMQFEEVEGGRGFDCVGHGEFIVMMIKGINKGLLFDMERKVWVWMPDCPGNFEGDLHGFAYEPRLATPVTVLVEQLAALPLQSFTG